MGIDTQAVRLLLESHRSGLRFGRLLTIGRQNYFPSDSETRREFLRAGLDAGVHEGLLGQGAILPRYADEFWRALGASQAESMDASDYEGATRVHDLNKPVPVQWHESFDVVYDGGSLEHVFNIPVALANCMNMVRVGGRLIHFSPANNQLGHGFYQFSPELFFRVLSPEQGFRIERIVAVEGGPCYRRYEVSDPDSVRSRVTLINCFPVSIFVQAVKVDSVVPFTVTPQQSDYMAQWKDGRPIPGRSGAMPLTGHARLRLLLKENCPRLVRFLEGLWSGPWNRTHSFSARRNFKRIR